MYLRRHRRPGSLHGLGTIKLRTAFTDNMKLDKIRLDRRRWLKIAGLAAGSATVLPACSDVSVKQQTEPKVSEQLGIVGADGRRVLPWSNWSGNQQCQPTKRLVARSAEQVSDIVKSASGTIRCVGAGHSFSPLVPTDETILSLARLRGVKKIDKVTKQVELGAGTMLSQIGDPLWDAGLGLINMPDINTQSLAGAISTSTHGTGSALGSMSSDVTELEIVDAHGQIIRCNSDHNADVFNAARNNLGALGVVTSISIQARDKYYLSEQSWMLSTEEALASAQQLRDENRHFEMYAFPHADYMLMITINEVDKPSDKTEAELANNAQTSEESDKSFRTMVKLTDNLPWIKSFILNRSLGGVEPTQRADRSYRVFGNLRNIRFNEMEYTVPADKGEECLREIMATIKKENIDVVFPLEYRYVKADDIHLSQFYERDGCSISCHNFQGRDYKKYFAAIEPIFKKYQGRPHWGKIHTLDSKELSALYPRWSDFQKVRKEMDPNGIFLNQHLRAIFNG